MWENYLHEQSSAIGYVRVVLNQRRLIDRTIIALNAARLALERAEADVRRVTCRVEVQQNRLTRVTDIAAIKPTTTYDVCGRFYRQGVRCFVYPIPHVCTLCALSEFDEEDACEEENAPMIACLNTSCVARLCGPCFNNLAMKECPVCRSRYYGERPN